MKVLGIVGFSDSGKTTLVEKLISNLKKKGKAATVKHLDHSPDLDTKGKDTFRHRKAGSSVTYGVTDENGWFATGEGTMTLTEILEKLAPEYDYVIVEGFSSTDIPKIVIGEKEYNGPTIKQISDIEDININSIIEEFEKLDSFKTLNSLIKEVKDSPEVEKAGAIATFTGRVRAKEKKDDRLTKYLKFEKYDKIAEEKINNICNEIEKREGVYKVAIHHRTGKIKPGENIVFVVVLAGHRQEAFNAVQDGINILKNEVPIFKKEIKVDTEFWSHNKEKNNTK